MTEIRHPNYSVDLPGDWTESSSDEQGTVAFLADAGGAVLFVTLLSVKPVFAIAGRELLLRQYMDHRKQWEKGQIPDLEQSEADVVSDGDRVDGTWSGIEPDTGRRVRHRVLLEGSLLADFAYESFGMDETSFDEQAAALLSTTAISAP